MHVSERVCVGMGACSAGRGGAASPGPGRAGFRKIFPDPIPDPVPDPVPDPEQRPFISVNRCIASIY